MKISARNQIKGTVKTVKEGAVNAVVTICRGSHNPIKADITMEAVKQLGLEEGKECYAVVKATNVMFATSKIEGISARNQIEGTVVKVQEGAVNGHATIEDEESAGHLAHPFARAAGGGARFCRSRVGRRAIRRLRALLRTHARARIRFDVAQGEAKFSSHAI